MKLIVGPPVGRADLIPAAREAWSRFEDELSGPVFPYSGLELRPLEGSVGNVIACAYQRIGPRYQRNEHVQIILSEQFFEAPAARRTLTLLHENIHLLLICDGLRERAIRARELEITHKASSFDVGLFEFELARHTVAMTLFHFVDEILAEHYLQMHYPRPSAPRLKYYLDLRRANFSGRTHTQVRRELLPYAHLYEQLRNGLGVQLVADQAEADEFETMIAGIELSWAASCYGEDQRGRLLELRPRLLSWGLDPIAFDADAYDALFEEVVGLAPDSPEP